MKNQRNNRIKNLLTESLLYKKYISEGKSLNKISEEFSISKRTILDYLVKFDIPRRQPGKSKGIRRSLKSRRKQSQTLKVKGNHISLYHHVGNENNNYKTGFYCRNRFCSGCGKKLSPGAKQCRKCYNDNIKQKGLRLGKNNPMYGKVVKHWRSKGSLYQNIWLKSSYEIAYAKYLDKNNIKWKYEYKTFNLGDTTYTPDFYLPETNQYIEIKGWYTDKFKEKIKIFKQLYPRISLVILNSNHLKMLEIL